MKSPEQRTIFIHLPAYREPELVPTIKSALDNARYPERLVFGICRQYNPDDGFDNVDEFRDDPRFRIMDIHYTQAKGLPYARYQINTMLQDEDYICQLDSHHRFAEGWDETLIRMHDQLKDKGVKKPILAAYLPYYNPFNDPADRTMEPWQQTFACFYPHGTIFIRPGLLHGWQNMTEPAP
jgi:glycosyltransferase involved in cell wall biosynthesis